MRKQLTGLLATALLSSSVVAEELNSTTFIGANLSSTSFDNGSIDREVISISARMGAYLNEHFSLEGRFGKGASSDEFISDSGTFEFEVNYIYGMYARCLFPLSENLHPYALIGYTKSELELSTVGASREASESDISYGFGLDLRFDQDLAFTIEYANLIDKQGSELASVSAGAIISF